MKLLLFPLIFLIVFAFLSQMGIGVTSWSATGNLEAVSGANGYFDADDHLVAYANGSYAGEYGNITHQQTAGSAGAWNYVPFWRNATGQYNVYTDTGERMLPDQQQMGFDLGTSLGLIGLIIAGIIFAGLVGTRVLGSGVSDESVSAIWKGTLLIAVWGIFSFLALSMIAAIPLFGPFFYMFLTVIYCLGIINQVGHPGED